MRKSSQIENQSTEESVILDVKHMTVGSRYQLLMARKLSMKSDLRILLIDDAETQFYLIEGLLMQSLGNKFKLDWASSLQTSLDLVNKQDYDVCILDYEFGDYTALDI